MKIPSIRNATQLAAVTIAAFGAPICDAQYAIFDAQTDTIAVNGGTTLGTAATFEAVFSLTNASIGSIYFEEVNGLEHKQLAVGGTYCRGFAYTLNLTDTNLSMSAPVSLNTFHHFAFVRDGAEERLYFDGTLARSRAVSGNIGNSEQHSFPTAIGASHYDGGVEPLSPSFLGLLDSVRISSVARYFGPSFVAPSGDMSSDSDTLILYNFNPSEVSGGTITDLSGRGHSGTFGAGFAGATAPTIVAGPAAQAPVLTIRVSQVELCWNSKSNEMYQLQYSSTLTTNQWIVWGETILGDGACKCVTDTVRFGEAQRFYRLALAASHELPTVKAGPAGGVAIQNPYVLYGIGANGRNERFVDRQSGRDYAAPNSPCAWLKLSGTNFPATVPATAATFTNGLLVLQFANTTVEAAIRITVKNTHILWEVVSLTGQGVEEFVFADVPLTLRGSPGERFTASALALNLQTLVEEFPQPVSRLRASCFPRFGFAGAQVALLGCPAAELRRVMQEVVTDAPELPKSALGGPWAWDAPAARGSYLFDFGTTNEEANADNWIGLVQSLGFTQIDFDAGFRFGDFLVNTNVFPHGRAGVKAVIDKCHAAGILAGLHTYAFFIDKNAEWVTPVPDPRLASDMTFTLAEDLSTNATTVPVEESTAAVSTNTGVYVHNSVTLRVGEELITYTGVSRSPPYGFTGCQRGDYGTGVASHPRGAKVDHLKESFGLFVPDPETTLFAEVAQRTANLYNECGFDMIYLDALDGEGILGGAENGWHYGSQFAFELAKRLCKPALMEMSIFHHHLWYVRSRNGALDHPRRAPKQAIDLHLAANENNDRMFLPGNLGWWSVRNWTNNAQEERTFSDEIEYLCGKALGTDSGLSLQGIDLENAPRMARMAEIFKRYETLRHSNQVTESLKQKLRVPGDEFRLVDLPGGGWEFRPARYDQQKVETIDGTNNLWTVTNRFESQPVRLRIEPLMAAGLWDAETNIVLADAVSVGAFTTVTSAPNVSSELVVATDVVWSGSPSLRFSATNASTSATGAWTKVERTFVPPLNPLILSGREGLGLWVHGDGQGEVLNLQLRSPEPFVTGIGDHYIVVDFTGWRYFELVEPESRRWAQYKWPYGDFYSIYRESVNFGQVSSFSLWFNNLPPGRSVTCHLSPIKALPLSNSMLRHPAVTIGAKTILFPVELEAGNYLEMNSATDCKVYGTNGIVRAEVTPEGDIPTLAAGENRVRFSCGTSEGVNARANVTVISEKNGPVP